MSKAGLAYKDAGSITKKMADADPEYYLLSDSIRLSDDCKKHVKATSKVWMHKTPSLSNSYGKALKKDQKVKYRRAWSLDERLVPFYGVRYNGKCLWVSSLYTKLVK